ncbi:MULTISPECIES: hypothetical protein [Legionella]|uniref:Uncharacterized protein n=1 Tax=Legionella donaldsonii TaxID=45060 RepID=A0A378J5Z1_9GAMM|nr:MULTISPECIES: hypothetical protein [Legionella]MCC5015768.1 hypothetical protein [Legionella sp. 31fI33]STX42869.1 Uncharacterised protein [Legionella donaldsonii]
MLAKEDILKIINECRKIGEQGLNEVIASVPTLSVDFLLPPKDFLGISNNPAIFVNHDTYRLLGKHHHVWRKNKTIAVKEDFLEKEPMMIIGIIVHEVGHAFNVAAGITNSESNAYLFEIEVLSLWVKTGNSMLFNCSASDVQAFFESRLSMYRMEIRGNEHLARLVEAIEKKEIFSLPQNTSAESSELLPMLSS